MAQNDKANPILVSNKALQQPQEATDKILTTTGTILYANEFSGISRVPMPDDWKEALNSDYGETGNNIIIQLQQKIQQIPDGPWYVDSRDGIIYIHNRKLQEPPSASYTYQSENGELLQATFETQYVTKVIRATTSSGINSNKGLYRETISNGQLNVRMPDQTYLDYFDPQTGDYQPELAINAYAAGRLTYSSLLTLNERRKEFKHTKKSSFTESQWARIRSISRKRSEEQRKAQKEYTEKKYQEYQAAGWDAASKYREQGITETLDTKDIEANVMEYLIETHGTQAQQVLAELDEAARRGDGSLDGILKRRYSDHPYTFLPVRETDDGGATVEAWTDDITWQPDKNGHISREDIDRNPNVHRTSEMRNDGTFKVFGKSSVQATVSGYRLMRAYYSRKYGASIDRDLDRRVIAAANNSRKVTEKKLMARILVVGRPSLQTSQVITLHNIGKKWSGSWYIKKCIHKLEGSSGYTTEMELTRHKGIEGHEASTESSHYNRSTTPRSKGEQPSSSKAVTEVKLTSMEATYFNAASNTRKEDMVILKLAGVQDAVVPHGGVGGYNRTQKISFDVRRTPTAEERKKYGRAAAQAIEGGIKTNHK